MNDLRGKRIAVLAALREAGARVEVISQKREPIQAFKHHDKATKIDVDRDRFVRTVQRHYGVVVRDGA